MKSVQKNTSLLERQISCANSLSEKNQKISIDSSSQLEEKHVIFYKNIEDENQKRNPIMKTTIKITRMIAIAALIGSTATIAQAESNFHWFGKKVKAAATKIYKNASCEKVQNLLDKAGKLSGEGILGSIIDATKTGIQYVQDNKYVIDTAKQLVKGNFVGAFTTVGQEVYNRYSEGTVTNEDLNNAKKTLAKYGNGIDATTGKMLKNTPEKIEASREIVELYNKQNNRKAVRKVVSNVLGYVAGKPAAFENEQAPFANAK